MYTLVLVRTQSVFESEIAAAFTFTLTPASFTFIIDFIINIQILEDMAAPRGALLQKTFSYLKHS